MAQLSSPGVSVTVIDESFYTPAAPGTTPLIIVASAENKENGSGTGTAPGTLASNAGKVYLLTSQKDLADTFGTPVFKTDASNNPVHAGEQNEYGLQAAYSYLGVSNRVFAVRADIDLGELDAAAAAPSGDPVNGTWWVDVGSTLFGIFEWDSNTQKFVNKVPLIITDKTKLVGGAVDGAPLASIGAIGSYVVVGTTTELIIYYKDSGGNWVEVGSQDWLDCFDGTPSIAVSPHTSVPQWKTAAEDAITGSVWIKTTDPNQGAKWRVKRWSSATASWETITAPIYSSNAAAIKALDSSGGGANLSTNSIYIKSNNGETDPLLATFKVYKRKAVGATSVTSNPIGTATLSPGAFTINFQMQETLQGQATFSTLTLVEVPINGNSGDAELIAAEIMAAGFVNIEASVVGTSTKQLVITHKLGGDIRFVDGLGTPLDKIFSPYDIVAGTGTANFYTAPLDGSEGYDYSATLWERLSAVISQDAPTETSPDGRLWYSSVVDEIDIMIHDGSDWVGYQSSTSPYYNASSALKTDPNGPIVSATAPTLQSDGSALVDGDLWISTADIENFPMIYKRVNSKWTLLDNADQTTEDGVLFRDARYGTTSGTWNPATQTGTAPEGSIVDLLTSNYLDPDAPDPALYPQGMLLWNLRRSGFNVKQFKEYYIDQNAENPRAGDESMATYYPHRWVSVAANQENGAGTFGRHAQRKVVVQALQALVNANQQIRDEESRVFNLIACPGYPELIGEMINLNYDRGLTAFVVGDSPARLASDATSLLAWGTNQALALEDNDDGLVSSDEYLGIFYPWGYTSDNLGNNVVVPPSHMMLRTIALSDNVAYPWFAPAGTRRGGITNATAVGYVDALTGEFQSVALNTGQRDTLASVKVNPLTFITGTGLVNYGQYTRARNASSLDRINVARLVIYLRRQLSILAKPYIFEPNDTITRNEIRQAAESLMLELVGQRALYDYLVVCDTSNNTPSRIDRNELYLDIAIEPVKAVEFIYIPLRLKNTGEIAGLG
jgi:hypothetical protein